jgi:hypothetical protein
MRFLLWFLVAFFSLPLLAQIDIPRVTYTSEDDYADQRNKVLEVIDFLQDTPADETPALRRRAGQYLITWLEGTPAVTVTIESFISPFMDHGESLLIFMGGYTEYALTHSGQVDRLEVNLAATEAVVDYYEKNKATIGRHRTLDKLLRQREKGKLRKWVAGRLSRK